MVRDARAPSSGAFALAGAALGLGYLARPTTGGILIALVLGVTLVSPHRKALIRPLAALLVATIVVGGAITISSLVTRGSPSYMRQTWLYSVFSDHDVLDPVAIRPLPSPAEFV